MSPDRPALFVVLAGPHPGRWTLVDHLLRAESLPGEEVCLWAAGDDAPAAAGSPPVQPREWSVGEAEALPPETLQVLAYAGRVFPAALLEELADGCARGTVEVGRVTTLVHGPACRDSREAERWYEAAIHFSDLVLVDPRGTGVDEKWIRDFEERFRKQRFPCLFDRVKKGRPRNPAWLLDVQARRLSEAFESREEPGLATDVVIEEGVSPEEEEEGEVRPTDPYLRRNAAGEFEQYVPDLPTFALDEGSSDSG